MRVTSALALLVVLAGCTSGGPPPTTQTTTPTEDSTARATTTEEPTTTTVTATPADRKPRFRYQELSNESQRHFHLLLEQGHVERPDPLFGPRIADQHYTTFYVTYEGTTYEIRHQRQTRESKTCLQNLEPVDNDTIDSDDLLGHHPNLTTDGQRLVDRVLNGSENETCYDPTEYPLLDYDYVRKNGTTYSLIEMHGSSYVYAYWIEPVDKTET